MSDVPARASTTPAPIRVMIVDDHPIVRDGLKSMMLAFDDLQLVGAVGDSAAVLAACREYRPDVIVMDIHMPGIDGIAATRLVLAQYPQMKIIMLTSFVDDGMVKTALEAGAIGYLMKNVPSTRWPKLSAPPMPGNRRSARRQPLR